MCLFNIQCIFFYKLQRQRSLGDAADANNPLVEVVKDLKAKISIMNKRLLNQDVVKKEVQDQEGMKRGVEDQEEVKKGVEDQEEVKRGVEDQEEVKKGVEDLEEVEREVEDQEKEEDKHVKRNTAESEQEAKKTKTMLRDVIDQFLLKEANALKQKALHKVSYPIVTPCRTVIGYTCIG